MTKKNKSKEKPFEYPAQEEDIRVSMIIDDTLEYDVDQIPTELRICVKGKNK